LNEQLQENAIEFINNPQKTGLIRTENNYTYRRFLTGLKKISNNIPVRHKITFLNLLAKT
jgi:hypothetical protein